MSGFGFNHAVLPASVLLPTWVMLSWTLVLSAVALRLTTQLNSKRWLAAFVAVLVVMLPFNVTGYLSLAFQTPSLVLVAWALWSWVDALRPSEPIASPSPVVALLGVVLGWSLVVDTLNDWPAFFNPQLYALGFESSSLWLVLGLLGAAMLWAKVSKRWVLTLVAILATYVLLRLPSGNVWDALLDPFVWLALHVQLWRKCRAS